MSLLTYDETVKVALLKSDQGFSRKQLDTNVSKDSFWQDVIGKAYSSEARITAIDFSTVLTGVRTKT